MPMRNEKINIFVMTHCKFECPRHSIYIPLQVGHALHDDLGYIGDDSGDNISVKNPYYSELTGLYWASHNVDDADYMGLCHYRRFFLNESGIIMNAQDYSDIFQDYDIILPKATLHPKPYREVYAEAHNLQDLLLVGKAIEKLHPEYAPYFREALESNLVFSGNLFVTDSTRFKAYTNWLFSIFDVVEGQIDPDRYDNYHKRVYGFLSEQLLSVWVAKNELTVYEANVGITQLKSETAELKASLCTLASAGTLEGVKQALDLFRTTLKARPDLLLPASDLDGELTDMFRVLHVLELELQENNYTNNTFNCMFFLSTDLSVLVKQFRLITSILLHVVQNTASEVEKDYLRDSRISDSLYDTIRSLHPELK
jgi:hypothetical protein